MGPRYGFLLILFRAIVIPGGIARRFQKVLFLFFFFQFWNKIFLKFHFSWIRTLLCFSVDGISPFSTELSAILCLCRCLVCWGGSVSGFRVGNCPESPAEHAEIWRQKNGYATAPQSSRKLHLISSETALQTLQGSRWDELRRWKRDVLQNRPEIALKLLRVGCEGAIELWVERHLVPTRTCRKFDSKLHSNVLWNSSMAARRKRSENGGSETALPRWISSSSSRVPLLIPLTHPTHPLSLSLSLLFPPSSLLPPFHPSSLTPFFSLSLYLSSVCKCVTVCVCECVSVCGCVCVCVLMLCLAVAPIDERGSPPLTSLEAMTSSMTSLFRKFIIRPLFWLSAAASARDSLEILCHFCGFLVAPFKSRGIIHRSEPFFFFVWDLFSFFPVFFLRFCGFLRCD